MSEATKLLLEDEWRFEPTGGVEVKGKVSSSVFV